MFACVGSPRGPCVLGIRRAPRSQICRVLLSASAASCSPIHHSSGSAHTAVARPPAAPWRSANAPRRLARCARSRRPRHSLLRRCANLGARAQVTPGAWAGVYKPLWLAAALLNSGYSYFWDLERDWEIQAFTGPPSGAPSTPPRLPPPPCSPSNMCTKQFMQRGRQLLFCGWGGRCSGNRAWQGQRVALARLHAPVDRC